MYLYLIMAPCSNICHENPYYKHTAFKFLFQNQNTLACIDLPPDKEATHWFWWNMMFKNVPNCQYKQVYFDFGSKQLENYDHQQIWGTCSRIQAYSFNLTAPGGKKFAHPSNRPPSPLFDQSLSPPQRSLIPKNFKNFTSFFSQFWLLFSSKLHQKALFYA